MITRIEIDGFKTFQNFAVDLAPFQVIIGANGCGKSNFFDALRLLSNTVDANLYTSFRSLRGTQREHFTLLPGGDSVPKLRICVELLVEPTVQDEFGQKVTLSNRRLRYDLEITQYNDEGTEWLQITHESLTSIPSSEDPWLTKYPALADVCPISPEAVEFIRTSRTSSNNVTAILNTDMNGIGQRAPRELPVQDLRATLLNSAHDCDVPHALAVRQEMQGWFFENVDTSIMRLSTQFRYPDVPIDTITGNFIPYLLEKINAEDPKVLHSISLTMLNLVPTLHKIEVVRENGGRVEIYAIMRDQRRFPIRVLSDGTLRLLALATLRYAPGETKLLCYEDPEEAVHPATLRKLVRLMREMTTDLSDPHELTLPLRQLLVTTHSPELVSELNIDYGELLFALIANRVTPGQGAWQVTRMVPVCSSRGKGPEQAYALSSVIQYLTNPKSANMRDSLREVFTR